MIGTEHALTVVAVSSRAGRPVGPRPQRWRCAGPRGQLGASTTAPELQFAPGVRELPTCCIQLVREGCRVRVARHRCGRACIYSCLRTRFLHT